MRNRTLLVLGITGVLGAVAACVGDQPVNQPPPDSGAPDGSTSDGGGGNDGSTTDGAVEAGPPAATGKTVWVRALPGFDVVGVAVDKSGNTFAAGSFTGSQVDFGAGKKLTSSKGRDLFVVKLDPSGNTLWAQSIGGTGGSLAINDEYASGIAVDPSGDVYVSGHSDSGTITFGNTTTKDAAGFQIAFVAKLGGGDGAARWIAGASCANDGITTRSIGVAAMATGVYLALTFGGGTLKIDGGGTVANNDSSGGGPGDWAVAAFEPTNHALLWANGIGAKGTSDGAAAIGLDASGDPIVGGGISTPNAATAIVDTLSSVNIPRSANAMPAAVFFRLSAQNGKQVWNKLFDSTTNATSVSTVGSVPGGPALFGGSFVSTDFGKGKLTAQGTNDAWFVSMDSTSKATNLSKQIGGSANGQYSYESTLGIAGDVWGELIAVGVHMSTDTKADGKVIAGPPVPNYRAAFIAKYDGSGNVLWAKGIASGNANDAVTATSVAVLGSGDLRVGGTLSGTAALDGTTPVTSQSGGQGFVLGISP